MVYFSTAPVAPESLDPNQYQSVKKFKEWCYGEGLVEAYDNIQDFAEKFRRQFQIRVRDQIGNSNGDFLRLDISSLLTLPDSYDPVENRLSEEAKRLLIEAAKDPSGTIMSIRFLGGQAIQTNGINFIESSDRRSAARWEAALDQAVEEGLVIARGYKNEMFEITSKGYDVVDRLLQALP
ncbi:hypothetical protein M3N55_05970 [Roseibaca sp. V10]|uniref:HemN C-terminal domain-containing protein n=1 Tax=Roseinatronobacter domitianus TaxID=2940293 RepID=A0ABT0M086_9RHOB|nr:hypothetical protein [Roseibaca domitiana]MCL1628272.1 hypothetical protein [Roseibaca domitiana]